MNESEQDVWVVAMALGAVAFPHIATYGEVNGKSNGGTLNARGATSRCPRAHGRVRRQPGAKRKPLCRWQEMAAERGSFWLLLAALPALSTASSECAMSEHTPVAGPVDGGTLVNVSGVGLEAGSSWQCSFGDAAVGAEYDEAADFVTCYAPPSSAGTATLNVSINGGGSWCAGAALNYQFYPPPNVTSISPASGNAAGGTNVTVTGSGFAATGVAACALGRCGAAMAR